MGFSYAVIDVRLSCSPDLFNFTFTYAVVFILVVGVNLLAVMLDHCPQSGGPSSG